MGSFAGHYMNTSNAEVVEVKAASYGLLLFAQTKTTNSVAWVLARTLPTEPRPLVGEVSSNFCG
jgi:hypothetical protein